MKIIQTMRDNKLCHEAMLKNLSLTAIFSDATNSEDVERQAKEMERLSLKPETVKQVYEKRRAGHQKFKHHKAHFQPGQTKPERDKAKTGNTPRNCDYCGGSHGGSRGNCPASGKMCNNCKCRGHFAKVCHRGKYHEQVHQVQVATSDSDSDGDFVFSLSSNGQYRPTVKVMINGVKGRMEADSSETANIMDYTQYTTIMNSSDKHIPLKPATDSLYAYVQNQPLKLTWKFFRTIRSLTTDQEIEAEFLVLENNWNSRPLLSLTTGTNLGIISIANAVTGTPLNKDQLNREFHSTFNGFGKHTKIKAKYIEDT